MKRIQSIVLTILIPILVFLANVPALATKLPEAAQPGYVSKTAVKAFTAKANDATTSSVAIYGYNTCGKFVNWCFNAIPELVNARGGQESGTAASSLIQALLWRKLGTFFWTCNGTITKANDSTLWKRWVEEKVLGPSSQFKRVSSFTPEPGDIVLFSSGWDDEKNVEAPTVLSHVGIMVAENNKWKHSSSGVIYPNPNTPDEGFDVKASYRNRKYNWREYIVGFFRFNTEENVPCTAEFFQPYIGGGAAWISFSPKFSLKKGNETVKPEAVSVSIFNTAGTEIAKGDFVTDSFILRDGYWEDAYCTIQNLLPQTTYEAKFTITYEGKTYASPGYTFTTEAGECFFWGTINDWGDGGLSVTDHSAVLPVQFQIDCDPPLPFWTEVGIILLDDNGNEVSSYGYTPPNYNNDTTVAYGSMARIVIHTDSNGTRLLAGHKYSFIPYTIIDGHRYEFHSANLSFATLSVSPNLFSYNLEKVGSAGNERISFSYGGKRYGLNADGSINQDDEQRLCDANYIDFYLFNKDDALISSYRVEPKRYDADYIMTNSFELSMQDDFGISLDLGYRYSVYAVMYWDDFVYTTDLNPFYCGLPKPDYILPESCKIIEEEAFKGCPFYCVKLGNSTKQIKDEAFASCPDLLCIYIPEETTFIASDAFEGSSSKFTIYGKSDSYAQTFAKSKGYRFVSLD